MSNDLYLRVVLTAIAGALVYLCVALTPMPVVSAQSGRVVGGRTPGEYTGPAEVVIVGWRTADEASLPVHITRGDVRVVNEVRVTGRVEAVHPQNGAFRSVLVGYEEGFTMNAPRYTPLDAASGRGIPVTALSSRP